MFEKQAVSLFIGQALRYGRIKVCFWDGQEVVFGEPNVDIPQFTVAITTPAAVRMFLSRSPSVAFGEAYARGWIQIDECDLFDFFRLVEVNRRPHKLRLPFGRAVNLRGVQKGRIQHHYDVGNAYYELWLGQHWVYSCGRALTWDDALDDMQKQKVEYLLQKLGLVQRVSRGTRLLDIGCGWGHLAVAAARQYGVEVLGITLSEEQLSGARALAKRENVEHLVKFELLNYQDLDPDVHGRFDRVISVGMFEHVGRGNHARYFGKVAEMLTDSGISVLHTITTQRPHNVNPWVRKHIFPGGELPTLAMISDGLAAHGLWFTDAENLWQHYGLTLEHWRRLHRDRRDKIVAQFGETLYRTRDLWLAGSAVAFYYGDLGLTQVVFTRRKPEPVLYPLTRRFMEGAQVH